jgi:hypothetical protein
VRKNDRENGFVCPEKEDFVAMLAGQFFKDALRQGSRTCGMPNTFCSLCLSQKLIKH